MVQMPNRYYDRTDESKNYKEHLFIAGAALQSAELNEIQKYANNRLKGIADVLFKDGDVVRDARIVVNSGTGAVTAESGAVYIRGDVQGVQAAQFDIPVIGTVAVGLYLVETVVTALEDPLLRDPATGTRNYQEPGAARLKVICSWGYNGDGSEGEFYPVYEVVDGVLRSKEPPPNIDAVTQSLARYDRDSAGGSYVVSGLNVQMIADSEDGHQIYSIGEGRARVDGYGVELPAAIRLAFEPEKDLRYIDTEPHVSTTAGSQVITLDRFPVQNITQVRITEEKTVTLTHGAYSGVMDPLPDTSVLSIIEVKQGATTYVNGTDYRLTAGKVDWSLTGAEPSTGSTYTVKYQHITTIEPTSVTTKTITVTGAVVNSLVLVSYNQILPRIDRLAMDVNGEVIWIKGVAADWQPQAPSVPTNLLGIASIYQTWDASRVVRNDGVRVVPMTELFVINSRIDYVLGLVAQQRLESDIHMREAGAKKGVFTDPFLDDSQRDQGIAQTAAIVNGELTLPVENVEVSYVSNDVTAPTSLTYTSVTALEQVLRTGSMNINPYMAFAIMPATVAIVPAVDRWTEIQTTWASPLTQRFVTGSGNVSSVSVDTGIKLLSSKTTNIEFLRQIDVSFSVKGFGPGENLASITFDGVPVTPVSA